MSQPLWYLFFVAKDYDPIKDARRKFVQSRVAATGRSDAESKAKFRQRFDKLSSTKEGRQQIAKVTNVAGIRKAIVQANKGKGGGGTGGGGSTANNKYGRAATAEEARVYKQGSMRKGPTYTRVNLDPAAVAAAAAQLESDDPAWGGPLNQFGMPAAPTRRDVLNQIQSGAIGNYNELSGDPLPGGLGNRTMDRVDYLNLLKKLKFWD